MAGVLFEDIFNVKDIDPEGKKFDRGEYRPSYFKNKCLCMCVLKYISTRFHFIWYITLTSHMGTS
jgi:hypothetical protein